MLKVRCVHCILTPEAQISIRFTLRPAIFRLVENRNAPKDPRMTLITEVSKSPVCTEYSPVSPKFHSVSLYDQPFSRNRFFENRHESNDPIMTLNTKMSKVHCVHWILTPRPKFHSISLYVAHFSDNWGFWFPHRVQWWILKKIVKNRKLKVSKIQNRTFVRTTEKKIQKKSLKGFKNWSSVLKFSLPSGLMLTKTKKKSLTFQFSKFQKSQT